MLSTPSFASVVTSAVFVVTRSVVLSGVSILSTLLSCDRVKNLGSLVRARSRLNVTSSIVSGRPLTGALLCHLTSGCSEKRYSVCEGCSHFWANSGSTAYVPKLYASRRS